MIANLFARGIGHGPPHWIVTRGFSAGVAPPPPVVTPQKTGGGGAKSNRRYRQPQVARMPINRLLSALPATMSIRGGSVQFALTRAPIIDPFSQARQEDELWLLCGMDANILLTRSK